MGRTIFKANSDQPEDSAKLIFRAVTANGSRRGIRLENAFWTSLAEIAGEEGKRVGDLIEEYSERYPMLDNATGAVRLGVLESLRKRYNERKAARDVKLTLGVVAGSPAPAFALSSDKKIISYNSAFLTLLQARLSPLSSDVIGSGLKLQLDIPFEGLVARLKDDPQNPIVVNYTIVAQQKALRGRMNAVLADPAEGGAIIGFLIN